MKSRGMLTIGCCHQFIIELHVQYISGVADVERPQDMSVLKKWSKIWERIKSKDEGSKLGWGTKEENGEIIGDRENKIPKSEFKQNENKEKKTSFFVGR